MIRYLPQTLMMLIEKSITFIVTIFQVTIKPLNPMVFQFVHVWFCQSQWLTFGIVQLSTTVFQFSEWC